MIAGPCDEVFLAVALAAPAEALVTANLSTSRRVSSKA